MNGQVDASRNLVPVEDLADLLGVSVRHVRRLVSEKRIPVHK
jgi:excisionase family DNA binding protein